MPQIFTEAFKWYRKAASQANDADSQAGNPAGLPGKLAQKDPAKLVEWLRIAASRGIARAQNELGKMYEKGIGIVQNRQHSITWYRRAADQNHEDATYNLGRMYSEGQDYENAYSIFLQAAKQGHADSQLEIGIMYEKGRGISQDYQKSYQWFQLGAEKGNPRAQYRLGLLYKKGLGVEPNHEEAMRWFHRASEQGYLLAIGYLSKMASYASSSEGELR